MMEYNTQITCIDKNGNENHHSSETAHNQENESR